VNAMVCDQKNPINTGKWDRCYKELDQNSPRGYGADVSYEKAAAFFSDVDLVEDWGCGAGGFKRIWKKNYIGIDGSNTPFADRIVDLCSYRSDVDGILIRHILEHNVLWENILRNAIASFRKKLCLVLFTPLVEKTRQIAYHEKNDVPDISFALEDLERHFSGLIWRMELYRVENSLYRTEILFYCERPS
jgi:hypothetical protein